CGVGAWVVVSALGAHTLRWVFWVMVRTDNGGDTGSGFAISGSYVLTNNHVVAAAVGGAGTISVDLTDGRSLGATIVGRSQDYDLAVLRLADRTLPALPLGNSDEVAVGDTVIAVGSPLGLAGTVTTGIISAENRPVIAGTDETSQSYINALQTDAAINPGNSGGPLVDAAGRVIGVNSAIATLGSGLSGAQAGSIGLGFAIPINQARRIAQAIIDGKPVRYPIIGVSVDQRYDGDGAKVADRGAVSGDSVQKGGPADKAGIQPGDVITAVDGRRVTDGPELIVAIRAHVPGDRVTLRLRRPGVGERTVTVTLGSAVEQLSR
ncbi:MAG: S1C family serine protease, partial [Actinomycetales bacterium]